MCPINRLFHCIIRVPKAQSAFTYFQLEAREGLCFYSTLKESLPANYRDLDIKGALELKEEFYNLVEQLRREFPIEFLLEEIISC